MGQREWFILAQIYTPVANTKTKLDYINLQIKLLDIGGKKLGH